ncbi:chorismate mutase [Rhodoligotrophos defluvii]|uniref:chorismate mutase n=1 Tax=Rhodoligotrophos defluvii TaxID=2561934 RepID=UPI0010C9C86D|nr:chorismate mutase [Rhodoligotrophos defluvii]
MSKSPAECQDMSDLRAEIDRIDEALVALLAERTRYVDRVVEVKTALGLPALIEARVEEVASRVRSLAAASGVDADFAERLWRMMMDHFIAYEEAKLGR